MSAGDGELLPCPFCGGRAKLMHPTFSNSGVVCDTNGCASGVSATAWNKRAPSSEQSALLAALREIEEHHFQINTLRGRDPKRSKTIGICRAALSAATKPQGE